MENGMRCYHCKTEIPDGAKFCTVCGQPAVFDKALIDAAAAGDAQAIAELYNRTYTSVYHTVRFLIKDEDTALDIVQDSYLGAFRHLNQLQDPARFGAWMNRIAHNRAVDELRRKREVLFAGTVSDDSEEAVEYADDRPESSPDVVIDRQETARLMGEILDSLPEDQRACITMFYYEQLSVREIASELSVSEATVKSRLIYGRRKIEAGVRDLEKKGTKLYGLAPIPLLYLLLRSYAVQAAELPAEGALQAVISGLSSGAAAAGGTAAAAGGAQTGGAAGAVSGGTGSAGAGGVAQGAAGAGGVVQGAAGAGGVVQGAVGVGTAHAGAAGLGVKIAAVLAVAAVISGGAAIGHSISAGRAAEESYLQESGEVSVSEVNIISAEETPVLPEFSEIDQSLTEQPSPAASAPATPATEYPTLTPPATEYPTLTPPVTEHVGAEEEPEILAHQGEDIYSEYLYVVRVYIERIAAFRADEDAFFERYDSGYYDALDNGINYHLISEYLRFGGEMRFGFADLNADGRPELVLSLTDNYQSGGVIEAYTFNGFGAKQLFRDYNLGYRTYLEILDNGELNIHGSNSAASGTETICRIADDRNGLEITETFTYDYEKDANGNLTGDRGTVLSRDEFQSLYSGSTEPVYEDGATYPVSEAGIESFTAVHNQ